MVLSQQGPARQDAGPKQMTVRNPMVDVKELWLFTMRFPFGHGEAFLGNELPVRAEGFGRVRLFPLLAEGDQRPVPPGVVVEQPFTLEEAYRRWRSGACCVTCRARGGYCGKPN